MIYKASECIGKFHSFKKESVFNVVLNEFLVYIGIATSKGMK